MKNKLHLLTLKLKRLAAFRFKNKYDLDNNGKVESIKEEVKGIFAQFTQMAESLDKANEKYEEVVRDELETQLAEAKALEQVIANSNKRINESQRLVEEAEKEMEANQKLKEKVSEFTK